MFVVNFRVFCKCEIPEFSVHVKVCHFKNYDVVPLFLSQARLCAAVFQLFFSSTSLVVDNQTQCLKSSTAKAK